MGAPGDGTLGIVLEFGGGTELLTATKKTKKHSLQLPALTAPNELKARAPEAAAAAEPSVPKGQNGNGANGDTTITKAAASANAETKTPTTMRDLVDLVCRDVIVERHSMLVEPDGSIRPGILVLINDADWELEGEMEYELQDGDHICMISTLHGG